MQQLNKFLILIPMLLWGNSLFSQTNSFDTLKVKNDFESLFRDLKQNYAYFNDKDIDYQCLKNDYESKIKELNNSKEALLFFEYFLDEFYDSHLHLNANIQSSYRLSSPVYVNTTKNKTIIESVWISQLKAGGKDLVGAEILTFNHTDFNKAIDDFPTHCQNKSNDKIRTWIANKILAGRYNESRIITVRTISGKIRSVDIDSMQTKNSSNLLSFHVVDQIGVIRINNSLGNPDLIQVFKQTINKIKDTRGIILDLRNTIDGGNTSIAYPVIGHFFAKEMPFQFYQNSQTTFTDSVQPTKPLYRNPLVVLVNRWTGSVGEGLASGLQSSKRAIIVGTRMRGLSGATLTHHFKNRNYGYQFPYIKVYNLHHVLREDLVPDIKIRQRNDSEDDFLEKGIELIQQHE